MITDRKQRFYQATEPPHGNSEYYNVLECRSGVVVGKRRKDYFLKIKQFLRGTLLYSTALIAAVDVKQAGTQILAS
ncbi:hypothetical protein [Rouxiella sp. Mn2063]|uniref:hypothetical protein n=1 Tax=Rouxiella sp. Mn2063 TaxID=3395262 RepID=UPI003BF5E847